MPSCARRAADRAAVFVHLQFTACKRVKVCTCLRVNLKCTNAQVYAAGRSKGGDVAEARLSRSGYAGARRRARAQRDAGARERAKPGRQRYNGGTV